MSCTPAPCCKGALSEATTIWPQRSTASDGICASAAHHQQNPGSDHEPNAQGFATAFDLTHDPSHGVDTDFLAEVLRVRRDPRIKYVIRNHRMFSSYSGHDVTGHLFQPWEWRAYNGANPHTKHMHVSILPAFIKNTDAWWPKSTSEPDDMPSPTTIVDAISTPTGDGTWLLQFDGGVITKGKAPFYGAYPGLPPEWHVGVRHFVSIEPYMNGYLCIADDGNIYRFPKK